MTEDSRAAAQLAALAETTPDCLVTIDAESRIRFANPAVEDVFGYAPDELRGEPLTVLMSEDLAQRHRTAVARYLDTGERHLDWGHIELPGLHKDGHEVPLEISFGEFTHANEQWFAGVIRDLSERKRHAGQLGRLNQLSQELSATDSREAACERTVDAARDVLDLPLTTVELYDDATGELEPGARTPEVEDVVGDGPLFASGHNPPWQTFVRSQPQVFEDLPETEGPADDSPLGSAIVLPIAEHGVLVSGATEPDAFTDRDVKLAELLVENARAAFDRLAREESLRERTAELEAKNERLERVQRVNREILDVTEVLMAATSGDELKRAVCSRLADSDQYKFVWFGERDFATDDIVPTASAGVEEGYLDDITVTADTNETGRGPAGRAMRSERATVQNSLQSDPPFEPWRQAALQRGYHAAISVPVVYHGTVYGVLNLYANASGVFSEMEEDVLTKLGELVGYALNTMERYDAFVSEESVELEFVTTDFSNPVLGLLREHGGSLRLENIGGRAGGSLRVFVAFSGFSFDAMQSFYERVVDDGSLELIRERNDETIAEVLLPPESFLVSLLERGAMPTNIRMTPEEGHIVIRIPKSASVREYVETLQGHFDDAELVARRESPESIRSKEDFERAYVDRLTERQREVLRTAYFAGFFEQPRDSSARDVAELLGVSQPTVSRHLRNSEQQLFSMLFGDE